MIDWEESGKAIGFGVRTTAALANLAFRLGMTNVSSGKIIGMGWLIVLLLCAFAYAGGAVAQSQTSTARGAADINTNLLLCTYCSCCLSMLGFLFMSPMSIAWLANRGRQPQGASVSTPSQTFTVDKHASYDGLVTGEMIKWNE